MGVILSSCEGLREEGVNDFSKQEPVCCRPNESRCYDRCEQSVSGPTPLTTSMAARPQREHVPLRILHHYLIYYLMS